MNTLESMLSELVQLMTDGASPPRTREELFLAKGAERIAMRLLSWEPDQANSLQNEGEFPG